MKIIQNDSEEDCEGFAPHEIKTVKNKVANDLMKAYPGRFKLVEDEPSSIPEDIDRRGLYQQALIDTLRETYE